MESSRRLAIAATLGVVVIALAAGSDFVFGSFWSSHAMLTSLIASLLVLAVTVVVLNEVIDRRDRRRWSVLAQYVLFQLVQSARATWMGTVELIMGIEIETGSTDGAARGRQARTRHRAVLGRDARRCSQDPERRRVLQEMLVILAGHSRSVIASWAAVMVGAGPYTEVFDRHVELQSRLDWVAESFPTTSRPTSAPSTRASWRARRSRPSSPTFGDDWLHDKIVSTTQLAVRLDYESRALGFKLVPLASWRSGSRRSSRPDELSD